MAEDSKGIPIIGNIQEDLQIHTPSPTLGKYALIESKQQWSIARPIHDKPSLKNILKGIRWWPWLQRYKQ